MPSNSSRSAVTLAVHGRRPITASMETDLPEPDSPTMASTSLASTRQRNPVDGTKTAVARGEVDGEIFDVEKRHRGLFVHSWRHYIALEPPSFTAIPAA